jgi:integrase
MEKRTTSAHPALATGAVDSRDSPRPHRRTLGFPRTHHERSQSSSLQGQHAKACKLATLEHFPIYTFRHTCLTRWAPFMDPWTLAYLAGYRDMSSTKRYVHPQEHNTRTAMEKARVALSGHNSGPTPIVNTQSPVTIVPVTN